VARPIDTRVPSLGVHLAAAARLVGDHRRAELRPAHGVRHVLGRQHQGLGHPERDLGPLVEVVVDERDRVG